MSVIGRLDEQVNAVLIRPLSHRREQDEPTTPRVDREDATPQEPSPIAEASKNKSREAARELPVWLL
jgi:hypothetical protein